MEYIHRFIDETSNGSLSNNTIVAGADGETGNKISTGANSISFTNVLQGGGQKALKVAEQKLIDSPLNQLTNGMYRPAKQLVTTVVKGASSGWTRALAGGVGAVALNLGILGIQKLVQAHEEKIAKLESEANESNENDSVMIRAGTFDIYGKNISYDKYGRASYSTDRR